MSDLAARIQALDPAVAERILQTVAQHRLSAGEAADIAPDAKMAEALAAEVAATPDPAAQTGDIAKASLLLLAEDPAMEPVLTNMIDHPPAESFSLATIGIGVAVLVVLQSHIKIEMGKDAMWTFKYERKPLDPALLNDVIAKLPAEFFALTAFGIGVAALVVLQSHVKLEMGKDAMWTFKYERKPLDPALLQDVIAKLAGWIKPE